MITQVSPAVVPNIGPNPAVLTEKNGNCLPNGLKRCDLAMLKALASAGRRSAAELARRSGLAKSPTQARLKRLEENGMITGYDARRDRVKMGQAQIAFAQGRLSDTRAAALPALIKAVLALPEVEQCQIIVSRFDDLVIGPHLGHSEIPPCAGRAGVRPAACRSNFHRCRAGGGIGGDAGYSLVALLAVV